jgi:hypothetical protein
VNDHDAVAVVIIEIASRSASKPAQAAIAPHRAGCG